MSEPRCTPSEFKAFIRSYFDSCLAIVESKNADYSTSSNAFGNLSLCEQMGLCSTEQGILTRLSDKIQRIVNLSSRDPLVADESIEDTLKDAINYLAILACARHHRRNPIPAGSNIIINSLGGLEREMFNRAAANQKFPGPPFSDPSLPNAHRPVQMAVAPLDTVESVLERIVRHDQKVAASNAPLPPRIRTGAEQAPDLVLPQEPTTPIGITNMGVLERLRARCEPLTNPHLQAVSRHCWEMINKQILDLDCYLKEKGH